MGFLGNLVARIFPPSSTTVTAPELTHLQVPEVPTPGLVKDSKGAFSVVAEKLATDLGYEHSENPELWKQVADIWNTKINLFPEQSFAPVCRALAPILHSPEDWLACSTLLYRVLHSGPARYQVYGNGSQQFLSETVPALVTGRSVTTIEQLEAKVPVVVAVVNPLRSGEKNYLKAAQVLTTRPFTAQQLRDELRGDMKYV